MKLPVLTTYRIKRRREAERQRAHDQAVREMLSAVREMRALTELMKAQARR